MIAALFLNPAFLLVAAALVSVPIIIHLINRMRFKRIRWAAMEFLLKAQKRTRRRLIIEQLILLALRCTLIALLGLLVLQFVGCGEGNLGGKPNIHIAILDDTLSMQDACWKNPDGTPKTCFDVAKKDFLVKKIGKGLAASKTNDQLIVLVLSRVGEPGYEPKAYQNLNDSNKFKEFESEINELQPSAMHVDMTHGIKAAAKIIGEKAQNRASLHILSDYRHIDWSGKNGEKLTNELLELVRANKEMKIRPIDTVSPPRAAAQGGYPPSRDNVGITEIRPDARIVGHKIPVRFTVSIHNFSGKQVEAELAVRNEVTGNDLLEVNPYIRPKNPIKLPPNETTTVVFDYGSTREGQQTFFKDHELKDGAAKFAHLSVRLTNAQKLPLENDGLLEDNTRHVVVEVREQVPILVVDGNGANSRSKKDLQLREMNDTKDSYILERALGSVPGASYKVVFGDELPGCSGDATKALERLDLNQYPTIYIVNVQTLKPKQISNLESYVREGGGVAFYMGPLVNAKEYNEKLYRKGEGVFPVPLKTPYYPAFGEPEIPTKKDNDTFELLTREDLYGGQLQNLPIFSEIFETPAMREPLGNLPIHRYFKVDGNLRVGKAKELATLPNDQAATSFDERAVTITKNGQNVIAVLANPEFKKYRAQLDKHMMEIREKARPQAGAPVKAYHLANQIETALNDRGITGVTPDLTELWRSSDDKVQALHKELLNFKNDVNYGDPFILHQDFGKGKVIAVMSTVGRDWNDWAGGSSGSVLFMPFIWEMQKFLSSPGAEGNLTVGTNIPLSLEGDQFKGAKIKMIRRFMKPDEGQKAKEIKLAELPGDEKDGKIAFMLTKHREPGVYISEIIDNANPEKPLAVFAHAFNVDTNHEGRLSRVGTEDMERNLVNPAKEAAGGRKDVLKMVGAGGAEETLVAKQDDLSESPWLFLILLLVLVAEQALAVHLSFHLKGDDSNMAPARA